MTRSAVYRLYDADDILLYVGASTRPQTRFKQHSYDKTWWPDVQRNSVTWYPTKQDAFAAEAAAIEDEDPKYNIIHRMPSLPLKMKMLEAGDAYKTSRAAVAEVMKEARELTREAHAAGKSEYRIAELLGVDRMTIRKWLGKRAA
jgi:hypothetical protein